MKQPLKTPPTLASPDDSGNGFSRRLFNQQLLGAMLSYTLLDALFLTNAFNKRIEPIAAHWAKELQTICQDLKLSNISQSLWQEQVENLFKHIELPELLKFIEFEKLIQGFTYPDLGVNTKTVRFPALEGLPSNTVFVKKIFGLKKDRAIIPHGHINMCSAHLVLKGELALKHYDKIKEEKNHLIIKPTIDKLAKSGSCSSISDEKDNIHWFVANTDTAFTLDIIMLDLNNKHYDIHNIDIKDGEQISENLIRAPKLDVETALKKYGKMHH